MLCSNLRLLLTGTWHVKSLVGVGELVHVLLVDGTSTGLSEQGVVLQCPVAQWICLFPHA